MRPGVGQLSKIGRSSHFQTSCISQTRPLLPPRWSRLINRSRQAVLSPVRPHLILIRHSFSPNSHFFLIYASPLSHLSIPRRHHGKVNTNYKIIERGRASLKNQEIYKLFQSWTVHAGEHQTLGLQCLPHVKNQLQNLCSQPAPTRYSKDFFRS